jgi:hypothetical protein
MQGPDASTSDLSAHGITVVPRVTVTQTFTDNVNQASSGKQAEQVTEVSPGIHIASGKGRLRGHFDYALRAVGYAQSSRSDSYLNSLDTVGKLEAVDRILYVDFMVLGLSVVAFAALWERLAFAGLYDFSKPYRTVALFWEMHVGGEAIDAYLALATPYAAWAVLSARHPLPWVGSATLVLLTAYTVLTTFSRGLYFALAASLLLLTALLLVQRKNTGRPQPATGACVRPG